MNSQFWRCNFGGWTFRRSFRGTRRRLWNLSNATTFPYLGFQEIFSYKTGNNNNNSLGNIDTFNRLFNALCWYAITIQLFIHESGENILSKRFWKIHILQKSHLITADLQIVLRKLDKSNIKVLLNTSRRMISDLKMRRALKAEKIAPKAVACDFTWPHPCQENETLRIWISASPSVRNPDCALTTN